MDDSDKKYQSNIFAIYILGFLFTLHAALPVYINSTYLSHFTTNKLVGVIYAVSSIITILCFLVVPKILQKIGNYLLTLILLTVEMISLLVLVRTENDLFISLFFISSFVSTAIIGLNIDIFLERFSSDSKTGKIRGTFLSSSNSAWIIAPLIASFILTDGDYWKIFLASAILILPIVFLLHNNLKNFRDPEYKVTSPKITFSEIYGNKNIREIFIIGFLLQFFYSWMVIYTPIYLKDLGFSWKEIGLMFSVMLLPFVITEAPLGRLADKKWGEKEVMSVGFIVMSLATVMISFIQSTNIILWTAILFMTRIGASMVEIMCETYFFKKVDSSKTNIISEFRTVRPWAYVISPLLATALFYFGMPMKYIFIALAVILFLGLQSSLSLEDTK